jgi:hypothetical protein
MSEVNSSGKPMIGWIEARGTPRDIGLALGRAGRAAVHRHLVPSTVWVEITAPANAGPLARMARTTRAAFPAVWAELESLADGLDLPLRDVFAWNCRGDLVANASEGCTTVQLPGTVPVIGHNEDGLPFFRGHCFMAEVAPEAEAGFTAFCYPGSLAGHTFAFTAAGMVQTVNNLRLTGIGAQVPRIVLGRAALGRRSVAEALDLLRTAPASGGFHFTLAEQGSSQITSVEFGGGAVSAQPILTPAFHTNHALHLPAALASQIVTRSSCDRQARGIALLRTGARDPLAILHDAGGSGLPILRCAPDDPDDENTLATAVFRIGASGIGWEIYDSPGASAVYARDAELA